MIGEAIVRAVLRQFTLPWSGVHGPVHWARVLENGLELATGEGEGDVDAGRDRG